MGNQETTENVNRQHSRRNNQIYEHVELDRITARKPWKLVLQNIEGLLTENSKRKVFLNPTKIYNHLHHLLYYYRDKTQH